MFYVYVYRDPRPTKNQQPVYVGKGNGQRANHHWLRGNTGNKPFNDWLTMIRRNALEPVIEIVHECDSEAEAHAKECELIALYGRRDTKSGPLFNRTHGGIGVDGLIWTPEYRERHGRAIRSRNPAAYQTPEFRQKIGANSKAFWQDPDYRERTTTAQRAALATPEAKVAKSKATKAGWRNEATREARIAAIKASRTPELRAQIGASCKALWTDAKKAEQSAKMKQVLATPEAKAQRSAAMKKRWAERKRKESQP